jgi:uncharacterized protein YeaO (DUF488 family)
MAVRIVRLGSSRHPKEGVRIGTVRRPPRGVPKAKFASENWYDVWFPVLAPSVETMKLGQAADTAAKCFSVGCYCEDEAHCHRSVLRRLLLDRGATIV